MEPRTDSDAQRVQDRNRVTANHDQAVAGTAEDHPGSAEITNHSQRRKKVTGTGLEAIGEKEEK